MTGDVCVLPFSKDQVYVYIWVVGWLCLPVLFKRLTDWFDYYYKALEAFNNNVTASYTGSINPIWCAADFLTTNCDVTKIHT